MFLINLSGKEPIYEQIKKQIQNFIYAGVLSPDDCLPSVRQLAQENGINPNTVAKAYHQLEEEGMVYNVPKKGVYVAEITPAEKSKDKESIKMLLKPFKEKGYRKETMLQAVEELYGGKTDAGN